MNGGLLQSRHSQLSDLFRAWEACCGSADVDGDGILSDGVDGITVTVASAPAPDGRLMIERSGTEVDALYGAPLGGAMVSCLTPGRDAAEEEARLVLESGRPMLVEDQVGLPGGERRLARLYLPVVSPTKGTKIVLCGVVAVARERS